MASPPAAAPSPSTDRRSPRRFYIPLTIETFFYQHGRNLYASSPSLRLANNEPGVGRAANPGPFISGRTCVLVFQAGGRTGATARNNLRRVTGLPGGDPPCRAPRRLRSPRSPVRR